ncbi:MAG: NAD(P)H-binding protein [Crocinitomicaceae bacterium]|nr:NAD(P)H-binding protein [Crocinitomicaceae bacterium]
MPKAIIIGATGLIGKALIKELTSNSDYTEVVLIARKKIENLPAKFRVIQIDFDKIEEIKNEITGDVLFSVLGTTMKTAGSKEAQYKIDFDYQYNVARIASENGVKNLVLLSSAGANSKSSIFYSRMKGELDDAVKKLNFSHISIIRPSMLTGKRKEFRLGEKIFTPVAYILNIIPFARKYRPIKDVIVAQAMINAVTKNPNQYQIYELNEVFKLAGKQNSYK